MLLWDALGVTSVDTGVFGLMERHLEKDGQALEARLTRFALVSPDGVLGEAVASLVPSARPRRVFTDRQAALVWLGAEAIAHELDEAERVTRETFAGGSLALQGGPLLIGPKAHWFVLPSGERVELGVQRALAPMLLALARQGIARPREPLSTDALLGHGWPGENVVPSARGTRVRVAIARLRRLGLRDLIVTSGEGIFLHAGRGYMLRPDVPITIEESESY
jgi:hypothetical protein